MMISGAASFTFGSTFAVSCRTLFFRSCLEDSTLGITSALVEILHWTIYNHQNLTTFFSVFG